VTHEFSLRFKQLSLIRGLAGKHESKEVAAEAAGFFALSIRLYEKGLIKSEALHARLKTIQNLPLKKGSRILGVRGLLCKS